MRRGAVMVLLALLAPAPATAQRLSVGLTEWGTSVIGGATQAQRFTAAGLGGDGRVQIGPLVLSGSYMMWRFNGPYQIRGRTSTAGISVRVASWLEVGPEVEARRFEKSDSSSVQLWQLMGGNLRLTVGMGTPGLAGTASVSLLPVSQSPSNSRVSAVRATVGGRYAFPRTPLAVEVAYRFEQFNMTGAENDRIPFFGVTGGVRLLIGR